MTDTSSIHQTDNTIIERHNSSIDPSREMRVRAAWLYYVEGLTQQATAKLLKIKRVQVTRLLAEARKRGEVDIRINASISSIIEVERAVEHAFGIAKVIIAPMASEELDPTKAIASIAGQFISNYVQSDMKIGVGWGRTLYSTLPHIRGSDLEKIRVI